MVEEKITASPDGTLRGGFLKEKHENGDVTADFPPIGRSESLSGSTLYEVKPRE